MANNRFKIGNAGFDLITVNNFETSPAPIPVGGYDKNKLLEYYNLSKPSVDSHISVKEKGGISSVSICGNGYCFTYGNRNNRSELVAYAHMTIYASNGDGNNVCNLLPSNVWAKLSYAFADLYNRYGIRILADYNSLTVPECEINKTIPLIYEYHSYDRVFEFLQERDASVGAKVMSGYTKGENGNNGSKSYRNDSTTMGTRLYNKTEEFLKKKKENKSVNGEKIPQSSEPQQSDADLPELTGDNEAPEIEDINDIIPAIENDYDEESEEPQDTLRYEILLKKTRDFRNYIRRTIKSSIEKNTGLSPEQKKAQHKYYDSINVLPLCWITDDNLEGYYSFYIEKLRKKIQEYIQVMYITPVISDSYVVQSKKGSKVSLINAVALINHTASEKTLYGIMLKNALHLGFDNGELLAANFLADVAAEEDRSQSGIILLDVSHIKCLLECLPFPEYWGEHEKEDFYHYFETICEHRYHDRYVGQLERLEEIFRGLLARVITTVHMP